MPRRIVDLSHPLHEGMTTYPSPNHPRLEITQLGRHGIENRETRKIVLGTHTGTHCDAPRHFVPGGGTIDDVPLDLLIGPARLVDLTEVKPRSAVPPDLLRAKAGEAPGERLVLRYDWSRHWGTMAFYEDHPFLTVEAARWLVDRGVRLLGMDSPTPDDPRDNPASGNDSPVHKILLGAGVILVEYLRGLAEIGAERFDLVAMPLKVREGDGATARCAAIVDAP